MDPGEADRGPAGDLAYQRELDALELIALGLTNAAIARPAKLSRRAVDTHVERIPGKLGAPTRTRAFGVALAHRLPERALRIRFGRRILRM